MRDEGEVVDGRHGGVNELKGELWCMVNGAMQ